MSYIGSHVLSAAYLVLFGSISLIRCLAFAQSARGF